ncbi:MAG: hypothetical protein M1830_004417 [Pleopsidium flavum]|nr:MAG: hypothetical protein M1830_004417 [Pleopsidium flavum]
MVSVGDPAEISKIYGIGGNFIKSEFYPVLQPYSKGKLMPGLFNTTNNKLHRLMRRPIASIYSMSNLVDFEPYVDSTMKVFFDQLDKHHTQTDNICDLGVWLQWFAFDVMGEITFSRRLGFLERAEDVDGIMGSIWKKFEYSALVGQITWLDILWDKNPVLEQWWPSTTSPVVAFAVARANERLGLSQDSAQKKSELNARDFLSRFIEAKYQDPDIPDWFLTAWTTSNVLAGSDTTAILLRSIFYFLLKHPQTLYHLESELQQAADEGKLSNPVTWKESRSLPYLDACVKEAGRLHPAIGLPLERVVPAGGADICGQRFEQDTIVGISAWVAHQDKDTFGQDAAAWRPERWLCAEPDQHRMERSLLTFGAGHRTCIGKNISYLEIYKLVPTILRTYQVQLANPRTTWTVKNAWLVGQTGLEVRLRRKE